MEEKVKSLKVKEANNLLRLVLLALIVHEGIDETEITTDSQPNEIEDDPLEDDTMTQSGNVFKIPEQKSREIPGTSNPEKAIEKKEPENKTDPKSEG